VRLKVALQLLPSVTEVTVHKTVQRNKLGFVFTRNVSTKKSQDVLYKVTTVIKDGNTQEQSGKITIPPAVLSITKSLQELQHGKYEQLKIGVFSLIPSGNDYVAGQKRSITF
jgi:hypothetical protein